MCTLKQFVEIVFMILLVSSYCLDQHEIIKIPSVEYQIFSGQLLNALISGNSSHIAQVFNIKIDDNKPKVLALAIGVAVADDNQSSDVQVRARAYKKDTLTKSSTQAISKTFGGEWDQNDDGWGSLYIDKTAYKQTYNKKEFGKLISVSYSEDKESVAFAYADTQAIDELVIQTEQITDIAILKLNNEDEEVDAVVLAQDTASSIAVAIAVTIAKAYGYVDVSGMGGSAYAFSSTATEAYAKAVSLTIIHKLYVVESQQIMNAFAEAMGYLISRTAAQASIQVFSEGGSFEDQVEAVQVAVAESISTVLTKAFVEYEDNQMEISSVVQTSTDQHSSSSYETSGYDTTTIEVKNNCEALSKLARALLISQGDDELQVALQNMMNGCEKDILLRTYLPQQYQQFNLIAACPYACKEAICNKEIRKFDVVALCDHYRQIILSQFKTRNFCSCQVKFEDELALHLANMEFATECPKKCRNRVCNNQKFQKEYSWRGTCGENDAWRIWQSKYSQGRCSCKK